MKLRTKLFLSIGILFLLFALAALFVEDYLVDKELTKTESSFSKEIIRATKKNREKLESYLTETISGYEGEVDGFLREHRNLHLTKNQIWPFLSSAVKGNPWIDYLSVSLNGVEEAIIPSNAKLYSFSLSSKDKDLYIKEKKEVFSTIKIEIPSQWKKYYPVEKIYLLKKKQGAPKVQWEKKVYSIGQRKGKLPPTSREKTEQQAFEEAYERHNTRTDIAYLSTILAEKKIEGFSVDGVAVIYSNNEGGVLLTDEIFFTFPLSKEAFKQNRYVIFSSPASHNFFLGARSKEKVFTLTVGRVISQMVEDLSLITGELVIAKHDRHYLAAKEGEKVALSLPQFPDRDVGEVTINQERLIFSKIVPFKDSDLSFYLLQKKSKAFAMLDFMRSRIQSVITTISWNMRIMGLVALGIALFFLQRIATAVSKPITMLAHATKEVVNGHYEKAKLPKKKSNDEVGFLIDSFSDMVKGLQEREKVQGALNKVVSKEIANKLLKEEIHLGGEEREGVILFADIRDFTHHTEKMPPQEVISFLNECMTRISHLIDQHHGVIDKYVGDEVMALFGIPVVLEDNAKQAVDCAVEIQRQMKEWNKERESKGLFPIEIGIGIHKGKVVAGNMGSENRLNYTVVGSNVNLASRLCGKAEGGEILISHAIADIQSLSEKYRFKELDSLSLKGFSEKIPVFSVEA